MMNEPIPVPRVAPKGAWSRLCVSEVCSSPRARGVVFVDDVVLSVPVGVHAVYVFGLQLRASRGMTVGDTTPVL